MYKFLLVILISFCPFFYSLVQAEQTLEDSYNEIQAIANYIISHEGYQQPFYDEEMLEIESSIAFEKHLHEDLEDPNFHTFQTLANSTIELGRFGKEEVAENLRITFINGIMNAKEDLLNSVQAISISHGHAPVHYVFQPTEGWTWDLLKSAVSKIGVYTSSHAQALARLWKSLIEEMGGPGGGGTIIHYAHSIGGTNTLRAKSLLTPEEQSMIQVVTLGSPTMIPDEGFQSVINYVSVHDWVTFLDANRLFTYFTDYAHIICVGDPDNPPIARSLFVDHLLDDETYKALIIYHGQKFIELITNLSCK
ncbi:MAG: hypothetical protein ACXU9U_05740 [Parachlamydiaceae bacterium]